MAKMKKVLLMLLKGGNSQGEVAAVLHVSKRDVSEAAKTIREHNLTYEEILGMNPAAVEDTLFPKGSRGRKKNDAYLQPDMGLYVERKKKRHKLLVKQFWQEYCSAALAQGKLAYSYQSFCGQFSAEAEKMGATRHFGHTPGEKAYIDWAGDVAKLADKITGRTTRVYVLVVVLPFSGLFWARGFTDMRQQSWLEGHMAAFEMFGGVPRMLVPDNCTTATDRGSTYETLINKDYERFAEHYGTAVVPARVRRPRDKSTAEGTVNLVEEWIVAPSSEMRFYTLEEFNGFCDERVAWLNSRPFSARDGSRGELFEAEEAEQLQPLPLERYEMCRWCYPVVSPDYHITIDYMHYSVPHTLIGRTLEAKVTASKVAVYDDGELVCEHKRMTGKKNQYETFDEHMPPNHRDVGSPWSRERFTSWAAKIGPETEAAIARVLDSRRIVEQAFVPCRNILGLSKRYAPQLLEAACAQVNALGALSGYTGVKNALLSIKADTSANRPPGPAPLPQLQAASSLWIAPRMPAVCAARTPTAGGRAAMLTEEHFDLFRKFRIRAMGDKLREMIDDPAYDDMTFEDKMAELLETEASARRERKIAKLNREAGFKLPAACVEDIVYLPDWKLSRDRVARYASCKWVEDNEVLVIISKTGCGKSYLCQALGNSACRNLHGVTYTRMADMFAELGRARAHADGSYFEKMDRFKTIKLLVIDDFMTTPISTQDAVGLFEIMEAREGKQATLIASQLEPEEWYLRIEGELMADSILNRIATASRYLDIEGPNMREYFAKQKENKE